MPRPKRTKVQTARAAQRAPLQPKSTNLSPGKRADNRDGAKEKGLKNEKAAYLDIQAIASQAQDEVGSDDPRQQVTNDPVEDGEPHVSESVSPVVGHSSIGRNPHISLVSKINDSFPAMQPSAPPSVSKVQATPSMLSLSNFKRRPRQPSILQMVQQRLALEDEVDAEDSSLLAFGAPLTSSPTTGKEDQPDPDSPVPIRTTSSRKRGAQVLEDRHSQQSQSPSRKFRRITRMTHSISPPEKSAGDVQVPSSHGSKLVEPDPGNDRVPHYSSPIGNSSSSELAESVEPHTPPRQRLGPRARPQAPPPADIHVDSLSPESTPPSSPSKPSPLKRTRNHQPKAQLPTTSTLQALLPKRRKRRFRTDEFEILDDDEESRIYSRTRNINSDDEDADELHRPSRKRNQTVTGKSSAKPANKKGRKPSGRATATKANNVNAQNRRLSKVYGKSRHDQVDESSFSPGQGESHEGDDGLNPGKSAAEQKEALQKAKQSNELKKAAEKFKTVDEWELSFESQDVGGESSSPWR